MKNKTLTLKLNLDKEIIDEDMASGPIIGNILIDAMSKELKAKNRQISKVKNPIEIILNIKTAKL